MATATVTLVERLHRTLGLYTREPAASPDQGLGRSVLHGLHHVYERPVSPTAVPHRLEPGFIFHMSGPAANGYYAIEVWSLRRRTRLGSGTSSSRLYKRPAWRSQKSKTSGSRTSYNPKYGAPSTSDKCFRS
jgi:hypothetical protein